MLRYATELEGHADNVAAALLGEFVINCISQDGEVFAVRSAWPKEIKVITVSPHFQLETKYARSILPETVTREDVIYNMQRVALFGAALAARGMTFFGRRCRIEYIKASEPSWFLVWLKL